MNKAMQEAYNRLKETVKGEERRELEGFVNLLKQEGLGEFFKPGNLIEVLKDCYLNRNFLSTGSFLFVTKTVVTYGYEPLFEVELLILGKHGERIECFCFPAEEVRVWKNWLGYTRVVIQGSEENE